MTTAKVFQHGNSQAVRLPKEFRVSGDEVEVSRVGRVIILRPMRISYEDALAVASRFKGKLRRNHDADQERDWR